MNVKNKKSSHSSLILMAIIGLGLFITSCMPEGREGHPLIDDFTTQTTQNQFCTGYTTLDAVASGDDSVCFNRCPDGLVPATSDQINQLLDDIEASDNTREIKNFLFGMVDSAKDVCFPEEIKRPDGEVFVKRDFCACKSGLPDVVNDCVNFCQSRNTTSNESRLYGSVNVGPNIELNPQLGNLHGWCTNELEGSDQVSPTCLLEVWSDNGDESTLIMETFPGTNRFEATITGLSYNRTYIARIVESGSGAASDSFQIRRRRFETDNGPSDMPLKIMPISQYSCLDRTGSCGQIEDQNEFYLCARRQYFYFSSNSEPPAMPPGDNFVVCHDLARGKNDNELFPRFELRPQHLAMWDVTDIRFVDQNNDGQPDINQIIKDRLAEDYNEIRDNVRVFDLFTWPNRPGSGSVNVGFYMQPWLDQRTGRAFCPGLDEYNGNENIFRVLGDLIGIETEGLFLAVQEAESSEQDGPTVLFIRESQLKEIWFYYRDGQHYRPDEVTAGQRTIRFYWPPPGPGGDPYIRQAHQRLFTIRSPEELSGPASGLQTSIRPPDKRFGCIPRVN